MLGRSLCRFGEPNLLAHWHKCLSSVRLFQREFRLKFTKFKRTERPRMDPPLDPLATAPAPVQPVEPQVEPQVVEPAATSAPPPAASLPPVAPPSLQPMDNPTISAPQVEPQIEPQVVEPAATSAPPSADPSSNPPVGGAPSAAPSVSTTSAPGAPKPKKRTAYFIFMDEKRAEAKDNLILAGNAAPKMGEVSKEVRRFPPTSSLARPLPIYPFVS